MRMVSNIVFLLLILLVEVHAGEPIKTTGKIERFSPRMDDIVPPDTQIEILGTGYRWSEGPVWVASENMLLFSDVPANTIYRWRAGKGVDKYLEPSGYTGTAQRGGGKGSNGLLLDSKGRLILCQHGDRRVARMDASFAKPEPAFVALTDSYQGKRLNSPNDAVFHSNGSLYFTDPSYGIEKKKRKALRETPYHGIYKLTPQGETVLLYKDMSWPNGLAFSPDEKRLYVANSNRKQAIWMVFEVTTAGDLINPYVLLDVTDKIASAPGLPDGLKVDDNGIIYATGPGGVLILSPKGEHLGTINTGTATANVAFNDSKDTLFITANDKLLRVVLRP